MTRTTFTIPQCVYPYILSTTHLPGYDPSRPACACPSAQVLALHVYLYPTAALPRSSDFSIFTSTMYLSLSPSATIVVLVSLPLLHIVTCQLSAPLVLCVCKCVFYLELAPWILHISYAIGLETRPGRRSRLTLAAMQEGSDRAEH
ncbi:hypothetical protein BV20DRAFT_425971 [Pilatotrama ljubarskyi]|nr:hypothetical protein BV20DRAFT_425971 [Pilatotrama ljubarskyi]